MFLTLAFLSFFFVVAYLTLYPVTLEILAHLRLIFLPFLCLAYVTFAFEPLIVSVSLGALGLSSASIVLT